MQHAVLHLELEESTFAATFTPRWPYLRYFLVPGSEGHLNYFHNVACLVEVECVARTGASHLLLDLRRVVLDWTVCPILLGLLRMWQ